ncbi:pyridine nucleotide-disulfide oxidoreductase [Corallococcus sp. H22C18031201]|nr:pyridine nucleotide-disulfide oxidoreductase [Corallococcus sp. H22C18031201]
MQRYDVVIVGAGPAGLSAALVLGRSRKRVLLCDAGPPRNAKAAHMQGFVTRDGTPPPEFRRIGREQLQPYPNVEVRDTRVSSVDVLRPGFHVRLEDGAHVDARRVLLAVGVIDEVPELPGFRDLWGTSIVQCPYCHGWEVRDRPLGVLASEPAHLDLALFLTGWSRDLVVFAGAPLALAAEQRERLVRAGLKVEERPMRALHGTSGRLESVELADGARVAREVLFARPTQRLPEFVRRLGLELNEQGFVKVTEPFKETSVPGLHAAGDVTTMLQSAIVAASAGASAAYAMNHGLNQENVERVIAGEPWPT